MFNKHDLKRNACMLTGSFKKKGYDWWWHSFTAHNAITGEEKPFFIEFFLCNPALAKENPTLGQLPYNKEHKIKPSYLMIKAGCWGEEKKQLHRFFSLKKVKIHYEAPYSVSSEGCFCSDTSTFGRIDVSREQILNHSEMMCDAGSIEWNLKINKKIAFNVGYGASKLFRDIKAFEMYWHAEGMKTLYSGEIIMDGQKYIVDENSSYGYADKNWGRGFTSPWVWLSSNNLKSNVTGKVLSNSVFDIGGGRPKVYNIALNRKLLSAFYYEGQQFEFNFSKFWTRTKTKFDSSETGDKILWHVYQENIHGIMDVHMECLKKDMLLVNYEAPDGSKRHNRLWNGGNGQGNVKLFRKVHGKKVLVDDIEALNVGCEYGEYDK